MPFHWTQHGDPMVRGSLSYTSNEGHRLVPVLSGSKGKTEYHLHHPDGHIESLGKRASFDHAERAIQARGGGHRVELGNTGHQAAAQSQAALAPSKITHEIYHNGRPTGLTSHTREAAERRAASMERNPKFAAGPRTVVSSVGPKGGHFHVGPSGAKVYEKK